MRQPRSALSASYQFAALVAKVSCRKFGPTAVGPLWADSSHRENQFEAVRHCGFVLHCRKSAWSPLLPMLQFDRMSAHVEV